jgi:hypothetical protein
MKTLNPNHLGKILVEQCRKVSLKELLERAKARLHEEILKLEVEAASLPVRLSQTKVNNGGSRFWLHCPICDRRVTILYFHPYKRIIGCRKCLNLEYKSRMKKGMVENS